MLATASQPLEPSVRPHEDAQPYSIPIPLGGVILPPRRPTMGTWPNGVAPGHLCEDVYQEMECGPPNACRMHRAGSRGQGLRVSDGDKDITVQVAAGDPSSRSTPNRPPSRRADFLNVSRPFLIG